MNPLKYNDLRATELLRIGSGYPNASFRDGQNEAIRHVVEGYGRLLVVQKTGWGKSFVYFITYRHCRVPRRLESVVQWLTASKGQGH